MLSCIQKNILYVLELLMQLRGIDQVTYIQHNSNINCAYFQSPKKYYFIINFITGNAKNSMFNPPFNT